MQAPTVIAACGFDTTLLSRVEDAGINASAPPQQRWVDGWLLRFSPGSARRARCINAVAMGRIPLTEKLIQAQRVYRTLGLPAVLRITPFTAPAALDAALARAGYPAIDPTIVMVRAALNGHAPPPAQALQPLTPQTVDAEDAHAPGDLIWCDLDAAAFAHRIGELRGSSMVQIEAHLQRLQQAPVSMRRLALVSRGDGRIQAIGQSVQEDDLVGLYDIHTVPSARGRGLATLLCQRLLGIAASGGAATAYLQVEQQNLAAQRIYRRLGFQPAYRYHYRDLSTAHPLD